MKQNIHKKTFGFLKSKVLLAFSASFMLSSCVVYTGGYSETDGVYYDPNTDVLPQAHTGSHENQVGGYYNYSPNVGIIEQSKKNQTEWDYRYQNGNWTNGQSANSDWGIYSGTEVNYYNLGWNHYWGWGIPLGHGSRFGYGWGLGYYGWGDAWGWHHPYWGYGSWGMYYPYWGWRGYGYWGYGMPYYYYGYGPYYYNIPRRWSGGNGRYYNMNAMQRNSTESLYQGMRTGNTYRGPGMNSTSSPVRVGNTNATRLNNGMRGDNVRRVSPYNNGGYRGSNGGFRTGNGGNYRNDGGGFRTSNTGGMRGSSGGFGGGTSGGGSRGGGMRTGGR